jgi:hypothetical protein
MKERGVKTITGISMIDFDGVVREFRWIASPNEENPPDKEKYAQDARDRILFTKYISSYVRYCRGREGS